MTHNVTSIFSSPQPGCPGAAFVLYSKEKEGTRAAPQTSLTPSVQRHQGVNEDSVRLTSTQN